MLAAGASLVKVGRELANAAVTPETRRREALLTADFATFLDAQGGNVPASASVSSSSFGEAPHGGGYGRDVRQVTAVWRIKTPFVLRREQL